MYSLMDCLGLLIRNAYKGAYLGLLTEIVFEKGLFGIAIFLIKIWYIDRLEWNEQV